MSKESLLLLDEIVKKDMVSYYYPELINKIKELLAQPEPEPVAWCQLVDGKAQDLLTSFEMKDWLYDNSWIPLYLAPLKREPLSELEIQDALIRCRQSTTWDYGFEAGVKYAEKMYGIGVGNE